METFDYKTNIDFDKFLKENSFEDNTGAYNCTLIKVDDIKDFWECYHRSIKEFVSPLETMIETTFKDFIDIKDIKI